MAALLGYKHEEIETKVLDHQNRLKDGFVRSVALAVMKTSSNA